ncbi:MAG: hypothetical protein COX19_15730 [Desulfobacterales bacterium CG23_combo_of_CG06-09_8_20_14_all_51_8]|nr:MAG: hypothetical protein COX19_15730 [Desulfobacterales bacterium CG23_combo_of_CG06-09_8_20_14_all_51_8]
MPKQDYYQKLFFVGALWNWAATLTFAVGYPILFPLFGMKLPTYPVFFLMFLGLAFVFGIGYYWVSMDLNRNHDIVKMGVLGKLLVFVALLWAGVTGQVHFILIGAGIVDLVFAILYMEFLSTVKKHGA